MKFRNDTDERMCGGTIPDVRYVDLGGLACMRTAGHAGECIALACDASEADKICFGCRLPFGDGHREDCYAHPTYQKDHP